MKSSISPLTLIPQWEMNHTLNEQLAMAEVEKSIKLLVSGKAAGADSIPPDVYKHGGKENGKVLFSLL